MAGRPPPYSGQRRGQEKEVKAHGAENLPSKNFDRSRAGSSSTRWARSLNARLRHIGLAGDLAKAEPKALRYRLFGAPDRYVRHARQTILKIPRLGMGPADAAIVAAALVTSHEGFLAGESPGLIQGKYRNGCEVRSDGC
jgi:hypothetical protein